MPNILVCSDSFKGSLSSKDIGDIFTTIAKEYEGVKIISIPIADGGEGTLDAIYSSGEYKYKEIQCSNPLFQKITAKYLVNKDTAIIEMAQASGLTLIPYKDGNAAITSSFGTGELILDAINSGCKNIYITVGGSATNDGGIGALSALGYEFLDKYNNVLKPIGENLDKISFINTEKAINTEGIKFTIIADVNNPLVGEYGSTFFYGKQKGAVGDIANKLENGMINYANVIEKQFGEHFHDKKGAGAAGGISTGLMAFLDADIKSGIDTVLELIHFDDFLKDTGVTTEVDIFGEKVKVKALLVDPELFGTCPVYLLTTDIDGNSDWAKSISHRLYDGNEKIRIAQETVLGVGGIRILQKIGYNFDGSLYPLL